MSATHLSLLNKGLVYGSAFAALILLAAFYSVVSSAVDRGHQRAEEMTPVPPQLAGESSHRQGQGSMPTTGLVLVGTTR